MGNSIEEKRELILQMLETDDGILNLIKRIDRLINDADFYKLDIITQLVEALSLTDKGKEILADKFNILLENSFDEDCVYLIEAVSETKNGKEKIFNNLRLIYEKVDIEDIPDVIGFFPEEKQDEILSENSYAYELYAKELIDKQTLGVIIRSGTSDAIHVLLEDLSDGEKIKCMERGAYSSVLATNGYVVKIGETRETYDIPYNPDFLQPLIRDRIQNEKGNTIFVLEVQPMVETKNITDEELEKVKNELEKAKIKYHDYSKDNMGRLNRLNRRIIPKGNGGIIESDNTEKIKKSEEVVIIDADCLDIG